MQKLNIQTKNLYTNISRNQLYIRELSNFATILNTSKLNVENKIYEILPLQNIYPKKSMRSKRGILNGLGSVFKVITGNLDASDGEHFENLIRQLSKNQNKLQKEIIQTHSVSHELIQKFNESLNQIYHHENLLQSKLLIIQRSINRQNEEYSLIALKDVFIQLINIYQLIFQKLQDIENSIAFSKLQTLHSSILTQNDLFREISKFDISSNQLPFILSLDNMYLFEKLINVESYIYDNRITFILSVPVTYIIDFVYYQVIPVPKLMPNSSSLFSTILPTSNIILYSQMYFAYNPRQCQKFDETYFCRNAQIKQFPELEDSCEMSILTMKTIHSQCKLIQNHVAEPIIYPIESSNKWIGVFPKKLQLTLSCNEQKSILMVHGTYFLVIPQNCQISTPKEIIANRDRTVQKSDILHFEVNNAKILQSKVNLTMEHFANNFQKLPILHNIEYIDEVSTDRPFDPWTIAAYMVFIIAVAYICYKAYKKIWPIVKNQRKTTPNQEEQMIPLPSVQQPSPYGQL